MLARITPDEAIIVLFLLAVMFASGDLWATLRHSPDFLSGWNAGYTARDKQADAENTRFAAGGLCVLATLTCPHGVKK